MERREAIAGLMTAALGVGALHANVARADIIAPKLRSPDKVSTLNKLAVARQAQRFTDRKVEPETIKEIVEFGRTALSHHNSQPWFISVVSATALLKEIDAKSELDSNKRLSFGGAPVAVIVSATEDDSDYQHYAIGCLLERMTIAAYAKGLGCKTVIAGLKGANEGTLREKLQIPTGYDAYIALLLGYEAEPSVDGVSGATSRETDDSKVAFITE